MINIEEKLLQKTSEMLAKAYFRGVYITQDFILSSLKKEKASSKTIKSFKEVFDLENDIILKYRGLCFSNPDKKFSEKQFIELYAKYKCL